jgi:hypothetical protein
MDAPNAKKYPKTQLNSIPTFHLYFTISNILYICSMYVDRRFFHPPVCFLPLLEGTASMEMGCGNNLGIGVAWGRNVKENGVMKAKKVPSR